MPNYTMLFRFIFTPQCQILIQNSELRPLYDEQTDSIHNSEDQVEHERSVNTDKIVQSLDKKVS